MTQSRVAEAPVADVDPAAVDAVARALERLRYGQIEIQVHDASVVRITRTEKIRFYEECTSKAP
jgi:hypothetical protein